jgi:hypothetical protein
MTSADIDDRFPLPAQADRDEPLRPGDPVILPLADGGSVAVGAGVVNADAEAAYAWGHCHALARALLELASDRWALAWFGSRKCWCGRRARRDCECQVEHVAVVRDSLVLDITGLWAVDRPGPREFEAGPVPMTAALWSAICDSPHWVATDIEPARLFAAALAELEPVLLR